MYKYYLYMYPPTSFRLSLPCLGQETSDVAENENPGAEKAGKVLLVFFVVFLEMHFSKYVLVKKKPEQAMHIGVGSGHICSKHKKLSLFLVSGHGT